MIDAADRKVHLIGHSYGGGLALHVALERSETHRQPRRCTSRPPSTC